MKPKYSLLLDDDGGIIDDLMATRRGDDFYVVVNGATKHGDIEDIETPAAARRSSIDHMKEQALLALQGPRAAEVLEGIVAGRQRARLHAGRGRSTGRASRCGSAARAIPARTGSRFRSPASAAAALADAIVANDLVKPIGLGARDSLRLEAGPAALWPRPRPRRPRRSWPTSISRSTSAAAPRAGSPARCASSPSLRTAPAQKRVGLRRRRPPAGARRRADPRRRGQ